ncbi:signal peptidase I [Flammeovirga pacifica]|uniref:Signal peptidase I n=1 Tax=Flammeovirga pacifica TaxID=915059 RepID=A0A1S1YTH9_FLAPC|nr:signal peptidase I [Flammeovirga pacifica]OHX64341.1 signal peptidase I [Flammeovirga pacifica]
MNKKRNPWFSGIANFFCIGMGQLYNGEPRKAFIFLMLYFLIPTLLKWTSIPNYFAGYIFSYFIIYSFIIYVIRDAIIVSKKLVTYQLKSINRWYYYFSYALMIMVLGGLFPLTKLIGVQSFKIASESMEPNLQTTDFVLADLTTSIDDIQYGDIIVYKDDSNENDESLFICRVVALPRDKVMLNDNFLVINNQELNHKLIDTSSEIYHYREELSNGINIDILLDQNVPKGHESANTYEFSIAKDAVFVIGDNRNNALDSRYLGEVNYERIVGKLTAISFSSNFSRIGNKL